MIRRNRDETTAVKTVVPYEKHVSATGMCQHYSIDAKTCTDSCKHLPLLLWKLNINYPKHVGTCRDCRRICRHNRVRRHKSGKALAFNPRASVVVRGRPSPPPCCPPSMPCACGGRRFRVQVNHDLMLARLLRNVLYALLWVGELLDARHNIRARTVALISFAHTFLTVGAPPWRDYIPVTRYRWSPSCVFQYLFVVYAGHGIVPRVLKRVFFYFLFQKFLFEGVRYRALSSNEELPEGLVHPPTYRPKHASPGMPSWLLQWLFQWVVSSKIRLHGKKPRKPSPTAKAMTQAELT